MIRTRRSGSCSATVLLAPNFGYENCIGPQLSGCPRGCDPSTKSRNKSRSVSNWYLEVEGVPEQSLEFIRIQLITITACGEAQGSPALTLVAALAKDGFQVARLVLPTGY